MKKVGLLYQESLSVLQNKIDSHLKSTQHFYKCCELRKENEEVEIEIHMGDDHFQRLNQIQSLNLISKLYQLHVYNLDLQQDYGLVYISALDAVPAKEVH